LKVYGREPNRALNGGSAGLDFIARLLKDAPSFIQPGGLILIEIESTQGSQVKSLAKRHFPYANISLISDLANHDRVVKIQQPKDIQ